MTFRYEIRYERMKEKRKESGLDLGEDEKVLVDGRKSVFVAR